MDLEIENFEEGSRKNEKEETLNKVVSEFVTKYKNHFCAVGDNFEELLQDLKTTTQEVRNLELEPELLAKFEEYMAKALLLIFKEQAKNEKPIDFETVEEVTTPKAFSSEIQNQFVQFAEKMEEIDKSVAYDVLKMSMEISEENLENNKIWKAFSLFEKIDSKLEIQDKQVPAKSLPQKTPFLRKILLGKGTSKYVIGKFDEEKQEWVPIREEYHAYPPKRKMEDCIGLEINDVKKVNMQYIERLPNLQELILGINVNKVVGRSEVAEKIKKVIFSDDVEEIGRESFGWMYNLEEVEFGDNFKKIRDSAFFCCRNLKKVRFGKNIEEIEWSCFEGTSIRDIGEMPFLKNVGSNAFYIASDLNSPIHVSSSLLRAAKGNKIFRSGSYIDVDGVLTIVNKDGTLRKLKKPTNPGEVREKQKEGWTDKEIDEEYFNWL